MGGEWGGTGGFRAALCGQAAIFRDEQSVLGFVRLERAALLRFVSECGLLVLLGPVLTLCVLLLITT